MTPILTRRSLLTSGLIGLGATATLLRPELPDGARLGLIDSGEWLSFEAQRLILAGRPLVRELGEEQISEHFPPNGTRMPKGDFYARYLSTGFRGWNLRVEGLVARPLSISLENLRRLPCRHQITQHSCDEGWSAIAKWSGVQVGRLLQAAGILANARYVVFHCMDQMNRTGEKYYESIDLFDAFHPQTILAYQMNGRPLPVEHGAPLRLRAEMHIGYKNAKYVDRIEVVERLNYIGKGRGSYWADRGFQWYTGL